MNELFSSEHFFKTLFDAIPILALVVNEEGRVQTINQFGKNLTWVRDQDAYSKMGGQVLNCVHRHDDPNGCGYSEHCLNYCDIRATAMKALAGNAVQRTKGHLEIGCCDMTREMKILISASPLSYKDSRYAVVIIEDVSLIAELQGLIPICAHCKKIRNDQGYWDRLEKYIENHSEAEFTHDICSDCAKMLYSKCI